ncbi:MAG: ABC transporter permease subunit [Spirochaetaceae bacterium]|nr:MAG: ABC transporter permease subunit [Spirochaetaceae bacterium]
MNLPLRVLRLTGELAGRVFVILTITFVVASGSAGSTYEPYHVFYRYLIYVRNLATFSLGTTSDNVAAAFYITPAIGRSALVLIPPLIVAALVVMAVTRHAFVTRSTLLQRSAGSLLTVGYSIPIPFIAVIAFAVAGMTGWFPLGMTTSVGHASLPPFGRLLDTVHHLILPWFTVGLFPFLALTSSLIGRLNELGDAPIVTAGIARGLSRRQVFTHHLRRPLLATLVQQLASSMPIIVTYLALVESVYRYTGLGFFLIRPYTGSGWWSVSDHLIVSQAALVYIAVFAVCAQFLCRLAELILIPQLRHSEADAEPPATRWILAAAAGGVVIGVALTLLPPLAPISGWAGSALAITPVLVAVAVVARARRPDRERTERSASMTPEQHGIADPDDGEPQVKTLREAVRATGRALRRTGKRLSVSIRHNRTTATQIAVAAGLLAALLIASSIVPPPAPLPSMARINPSMVPLGQRITFHALTALATARSIVAVAAVAALGVLAGAVAAVATTYARPPLIHRTIGVVGLFPTVLIVVMLLNVVSGYAAFFYAFLFVAAVRSYHRFRDTLDLLRQEHFTTYSTVLGRGIVHQTIWHVAPNLRKLLLSSTIALSADLIVLRANLRFVGTWIPRGVAEADARVPGFLEELSRLMYSVNWGSAIQAGVGGFVRGYYLPVVFPVAFLLLAVLLLRALAGAIERWEHV